MVFLAAGVGAAILARLFWWGRRDLSWQGRQDGIRGIPAMLDPSAPIRTPQLQALASHARETFEDERLSLLDDLAALHARRLLLERQAPIVGGRLENALAEAPAALTPGECRQRRTGEDHLDPAVVERRRRREHQREVEAHQALVDALARRAHEVTAELEEIPARMEQRVEKAHAMAARSSHAHARDMAVYWRALVRAHRRGAQLAVASSPDAPAPPDWSHERGMWRGPVGAR